MQHPAAEYIPARDEAVGYLLDRVRPGDVILTLGAGDSDQVGVDVIAALRERVNGHRPKDISLNDMSGV
jgi:UDP-N-acetylmuramate--alanine ligase